MATWHPSITAYEEFGERREFWNDKDPRVTVTLYVNSSEVAQFVYDLIWNRYLLPADLYSPNVHFGQLRVLSAEIINDKARYVTPDGAGEVLEPQYTKKVSVTYGRDLRQCRVVFGQEVLMFIGIAPQVEFLQMNWNDFRWVIPNEDSVPLRGPDEAPGKRFSNVKFNIILERVDLSDVNFRDNLFEANGCVNNGVQSIFELFTVQEEQVLFTFEGTEPTIYGPSGNLLWTIRIILSCKVTLDSQTSTWNKFFKPAHTGGNDISGWFEIEHKKTDSDKNNPVLKAYPISNIVDDFLESPRCDQSASSSTSVSPAP